MLKDAIATVSSLLTKLQILDANDGIVMENWDQDEREEAMDELHSSMLNIDTELCEALDDYSSVTEQVEPVDVPQPEEEDEIDLDLCSECGEENVIIESVEADGCDSVTMRAYCPDCKQHFELTAKLKELVFDAVD